MSREIKCGQCEGTGTTDAMGYEEECPVCDGTGRLKIVSTPVSLNQVTNPDFIEGVEGWKQPLPPRETIIQICQAEQAAIISYISRNPQMDRDTLLLHLRRSKHREHDHYDRIEKDLPGAPHNATIPQGKLYATGNPDVLVKGYAENIPEEWKVQYPTTGAKAKP